MDVSVIIVNYNTKSLLAQCLRSIYERTLDLNYEVIVVDNASTDGSQQLVKNIFSSVILIENKENLGFGRANNAGSKIAKGKYLFLLNSDTILLNNAIKFFFDFFETNPTGAQIGAIGGILLDREKNAIHSSGKFPNPMGLLNGSLSGYLTLLKKGEKYCYKMKNDLFLKVDYITGADLFLQKEVFNRLGGFDEDFFMYYEETDLQWRMAETGLQRLLIRGPEIIHLEGGSANKKSRKSIYIYEQSKYTYIRKHYHRIQYILFRIFDFIILLPFQLRRIILHGLFIR